MWVHCVLCCRLRLFPLRRSKGAKVKVSPFRAGIFIAPAPHLATPSLSIEAWFAFFVDAAALKASGSVLIPKSTPHQSVSMQALVLFENPAMNLIVFATQTCIGFSILNGM